MYNNVLFGSASGALMGGAFFGPLGVALGVATGIFARYLGHKKHKSGELESKSIKQILDENFFNKSTEEAYVNTYLNRKNIK